MCLSRLGHRKLVHDLDVSWDLEVGDLSGPVIDDLLRIDRLSFPGDDVGAVRHGFILSL